MKYQHLLFILCSVGTIFQSCKDGNKNADEQETSKTEIPPSGDIDSKQAYINKYNAYIAVWNDVSPRVERTYSVLYNTINDKTGTPLKEKESYYVPSLIESRAIVMLKDIVEQEPKIEALDVLAPDLISSYQEMLEPIQQLSDYYKLQSYKDDDFEKGSALYFKVREPIKKFIAASDILGVKVQEIDAKLSMEALAEYKERDEMLLYHKGMIINSLKQHSAPLYNISYDAYDTLDWETYDKHLKDMITHYTEFKTLSKDKERLKREMNISRQAPFVMYYMEIDTYIKEARNLKEMAQDAKKYGKMKSQVAQMGIQFAQASHVKVTKAGEGIISSSNDLNR